MDEHVEHSLWGWLGNFIQCFSWWHLFARALEFLINYFLPGVQMTSLVTESKNLSVVQCEFLQNIYFTGKYFNVITHLCKLNNIWHFDSELVGRGLIIFALWLMLKESTFILSIITRAPVNIQWECRYIHMCGYWAKNTAYVFKTHA